MAGVHVVLQQEPDGGLLIRSLLQGGQLSRAVQPLVRDAPARAPMSSFSSAGFLSVGLRA